MQEILEGALQLSASERKELLARLSLEVANTKSKPSANTGAARDFELWACAVQESISSALGNAAGGSVGLEVVKRALRDAEGIEPVMQLMARAKVEHKTPAEKMVLFRYLADLLVARARKVANFTQAPLTPKLVANNAQHLAGIFDAAFPGYLASGLAGVVIAQLIRTRGAREHA